MAAERFEEWLEAVGDDRSERHCRDNQTGAEVSRPDGPEAREFIAAWKVEQCKRK